MKRGTMLIAGAAGAVALAACSGKKGAGAALATGNYLSSGSTITPNSCSGRTSLDGKVFEVTVSGPTVDVKENGTSFHVIFIQTHGGGLVIEPPESQTIDWTNTVATGLQNPYPCTETDSFPYTGTILAADKVQMHWDFSVALVAGTASFCIAAENSMLGFSQLAVPCEDNMQLLLTRQ